MRVARGLLLLGIVLLASCRTAPAVQREGASAPQRLKDDLIRADYSAEIKRWEFVDGATPAAESNPLAAFKLDSLRDGSFRKYAKPSPTPREARLLGVTILPSGGVFSSLDLYHKVAGYFAQHGELPLGGGACLDYLDNPDRRAHFAGLSESQRMVHIAPLIDPFTGHLYASFDTPRQPFGFAFEFTPLATDGKPGTAAAAAGQAIAAPAPDGCNCPHVQTEAAAQGGGPAAGPNVVQTPDGPCAVHWQCTATRYGEQPGTVLERSVFVF